MRTIKVHIPGPTDAHYSPSKIPKISIGELVCIDLDGVKTLCRVSKVTVGCAGCCLDGMARSQNRHFLSICPTSDDGFLACSQWDPVIFLPVDTLLEDL